MPFQAADTHLSFNIALQEFLDNVSFSPNEQSSFSLLQIS
jgi:hypothetical protein